MIEHLVELTETGWSASHPMWCDDPLGCQLTQAFQALTNVPKEGRFWAGVTLLRGRYVVELGGAVPLEIQGTTKKTAGSYTVTGRRPG